jgi:hypothetical protein
MLIGCKGVARRWRPSSARRWPKKKLCELHQSGLAKTDFIEGGLSLFLLENKTHATPPTHRVVISAGEGSRFFAIVRQHVSSQKQHRRRDRFMVESG